MSPCIRATLIVAATLLASVPGHAQPSPAPNPLDVVPDKMPFNIPYGSPISLARAQEVAAAAVAEAGRHAWKEIVAVVDSTGNLVSFSRMDDAQLASVPIAEHKARVSVSFRRETKAFENGVQGGLVYQLSLDGVIASRGGIPLVDNGKLIGAIGVSGATASQDEVCAKAGAAVINK